MPEPQAPPREITRAEKMAAAGVFAAVISVFLLIPAAIAYGIFLLLEKYKLSKTELGTVTVGGVLGVVFTAGSSSGLGYYARWVVDGVRVLLTEHQADLWPPPILTPFLLAVTLAGIAALFVHSKYGEEKLLQREDKKYDRDRSSVVPSATEMNRLLNTTLSDEEKLIAHDDMGIFPTNAPPGKRDFPIGFDRYGKPLMLNESEIGTHVVVLGSTGSGKTVTLCNITGSLLDMGWNVVVVDLKEDTAEGGFRDFCRTAAKLHGKNYQELALSNPDPEYWFNPLYKMSTDEAINTILSLQEFDDGYWQAINRTMIGQFVTLFFDLHEVDPENHAPPEMYTIGQMLRKKDFDKLCKPLVKQVCLAKPTRDPDDFSSILDPDQDEKKSSVGLGARIINMYESEAGRRTLRPTKALNVMDVTDPNTLCYVGLNTLGLSELARTVSTATLMRLSAYAGARTTGLADANSNKTAVIIDEANWIDRMQVQNLLSRARSAGIAVFLATQGPMDWNDENGEHWPVITNNTNVGIIMRMGNEENAELCANLIGKETVARRSHSVNIDGEVLEQGSLSETLEYRVKPEHIRNAQVGVAYVKVGTPRNDVRWVRFHQRDPNQLPISPNEQYRAQLNATPWEGPGAKTDESQGSQFL